MHVVEHAQRATEARGALERHGGAVPREGAQAQGGAHVQEVHHREPEPPVPNTVFISMNRLNDAEIQ